MRTRAITILLAFTIVACGNKQSGGEAGGGGTDVGTVGPRKLESTDKKLVLEGKLPTAWVQDPVPDGIKLVQRDKEDMNLGHVHVSVVYSDKTPEALARDTADTEKIYGAGSLVVPATELRAGRWGRVFQTMGVQWRPGINMYEASAFWSAGDNQIARCAVRWLNKAPAGALDVCKDLEVRAP